MQTATPVSKEEVRLLAIEYGVREAARRCGLNEDRVRQWSSRYQWFAKLPDVQNSVVTTVTKPSRIIMDELEENERETRLSLSRYARRASRDAEEASLREAPYVKSVADVAGKVHKWDQDKGTTTFSLNVLNMNMLVEDSD